MDYINNKIGCFLKAIKEGLFKYSLIVVLAISFFLNFDRSNKISELAKNIELEQGVHIFVHPQCPHCHAEKRFIDSIVYQYDNLEIYYYDVTQKQNYDRLIKYATKFDIPLIKLGTPIIFTENNVIIGFDKPETTGQQIKKLFAGVLEEQKVTTLNNFKDKKYVDLPLFGRVDLFETSLPILTAIIGLTDGFNPCAMWVLVYLISIIAGMNDKRKIWFLVGTFVLSSGILYFLFMTAWLNAFLYIGYVKVISLLIGLFALYFGTMSIYEFIKTRGEVQCSLEDNKTRNRAIKRIGELATSKLSLISIMGVVVLAFIVNSIEFVCSAVLPAIYTFVLSQAHLSTLMYYLYILLYTFFFMLDDLIVFGLATFTINKYIGTGYAKYSHIIGGLVMFFIGIYLVFLNKI